MSWLAAYAEPNVVTDDLMRRSGSLLVGATSYFGDDPNAGDAEHEGAFNGAWHGTQVVLTHQKHEDLPDIRFVNDFAAAADLARQAAGDRDVNVLGADVARQCVQAGILDEVVIFYVPVLLGGGTPLMRGLGESCALERTAVYTAGNSVGISYRVVR